MALRNIMIAHVCECGQFLGLLTLYLRMLRITLNFYALTQKRLNKTKTEKAFKTVKC